MCVWVHIGMYTCVYVRMHIHIYMHIHTYSIYTQICSWICVVKRWHLYPHAHRYQHPPQVPSHVTKVKNIAKSLLNHCPSAPSLSVLPSPRMMDPFLYPHILVGRTLQTMMPFQNRLAVMHLPLLFQMLLPLRLTPLP